MADYKRVVSYIYDYESRQKKNNVGYSRVESRNDQCKVTVHLNTSVLAQQPLKVYLFHRNKSMMEGIYFGEMIIKNGTGDFRVNTNAMSLMNSPFTIDDISGVIIYFDDNKFFGSQWDDDEIHIDNFKEYQGNNIQVEIPSQEEEEMQEELADSVHEHVNQEVPAEESGQVKQDYFTAGNTPDAAVEPDKELSSSIMMGKIEEKVNTFADQEEAGHDKKEIDMDIPNENAEQKDWKQKEDYPECVQNILNNFPKVKPFPNSIPENWVRIEPKDIGMLPVETWILANNSFLLHGYYNYRHLIFGILCLKEGEQFVIGVPGMLQTTEQTMANMFGFHRFLASKSDSANQGNFGYWIQQVVL